LHQDELGAPGKSRQEVTKNVLKCATDMLLELRTGLLTPRNYYALYNDVTMQLFEFESFVTDVHEAGTPLEELYSLVQACSGNVVPRLYLLITTGAVYIKSKEISANQILKDLVEMAKGVQHPMRGLFVRYYLSHMTKDKLPDIGTDYETVGGTIEDAIDFVLQNFVEMNKLWVRMQHQRKREKSQAKRETERQALKSVVGTNLMRLAKMNGLDIEMYQTTVLPRLLEQITNCKDKIAQEYLMDCMVQVFPDSFHLATLEDFLLTCTQLKPEVDVADIIKNLMRRLSRDGDGAAAIPADVNAFQIFTDFVHRIITEKSSMTLPTILGLQLALEQFALKNYPGRLDYVDNVLSFCAQFMEKAVGGRERLDAQSSSLVLELLSKPLESLALNVLDPQVCCSFLLFACILLCSLLFCLLLIYSFVCFVSTSSIRSSRTTRRSRSSCSGKTARRWRRPSSSAFSRRTTPRRRRPPPPPPPPPPRPPSRRRRTSAPASSSTRMRPSASC
jgi:vacuolar protein sorting-associated protein 35